MKIISKRDSILKDNNGETIVEVVVAFALLSIMLVVFSQGITFATNANVRADKTRTNADEAMKELQDSTVQDERPSRGPVKPNDQELEKDIYLYKRVYPVTIDGYTYTYVVYSMD